MRWKAKKPKPRIKAGDTRTVCKFLLIPKCLGLEWRWFEFANINQVVRDLTNMSNELPNATSPTWCDESWKVGCCIEPTEPWERA